jgi:hypothetical protein
MPARAAPGICIFFFFFSDNAAARFYKLMVLIVFMASFGKIETTA